MENTLIAKEVDVHQLAQHIYSLCLTLFMLSREEFSTTILFYLGIDNLPTIQFQFAAEHFFLNAFNAKA